MRESQFKSLLIYHLLTNQKRQVLLHNLMIPPYFLFTSIVIPVFQVNYGQARRFMAVVGSGHYFISSVSCRFIDALERYANALPFNYMQDMHLYSVIVQILEQDKWSTTTAVCCIIGNYMYDHASFT